MKSAPNYHEALYLLRQSLDSADPVIEQCLKAHKDKSEVYDDLKHSAFQKINSVLTALKGLTDTIEPELNTRPIYRLLEEFRNNFEGAENVLTSHKDPRLQEGGKPVLANSNELASLIFVAVEIQIFLGVKPTVAEKTVAEDSGMTHDKVQRTRKRFRRKNGVQNRFIQMADKFIADAKNSDTELFYKSIIHIYQSLRK